MARTASTNFTGANSFSLASASTDPFVKTDVQQLAAAVDAHDHTAGKGIVRATLPAAHVYCSTSPSIATSVETTIPLDTMIYDTNTMWASGTNTRLTVRTAGKYLIQGQIVWNGGGGSGGTAERDTRLWLNGTTRIVLSRLTGTGAALNTIAAATVEDLAVNDYIEMRAWQNSGGSVNLIGGRDLIFLTMTQLR